MRVGDYQFLLRVLIYFEVLMLLAGGSAVIQSFSSGSFSNS